MGDPKQKPISKRQSRWISLLLATKLAVPPTHTSPKISQTTDDIANHLAAARAESAAEERLAQQPDGVENEAYDNDGDEDENTDGSHNTVYDEQQTQPTDEQKTGAVSDDEPPGTISSDSANPFMSRMRLRDKTKNNNATNEGESNQNPDTDNKNEMEGQVRKQNASQPNQTEQEATTSISAAQQKERIQRWKNRKERLDTEIDGLIKDLNDFIKNFKASNGKGLLLGFLKPRITFAIENFVDHLNKQSTRRAPKQRAAFLAGAILTLNSLLDQLDSLKKVTAFLDAFWSWFKWLMKSMITVFGAIVVFILGFIIVPFSAIIIYQDFKQIPFFRGELTKQVVGLIEKLEKIKEFWKAQLKKLAKIIIKQSQKKSAVQRMKQRQEQGSTQK